MNSADRRSKKPAWVDEQMYPFQPKRFATPHGEMSYLDEGQGEPILFVHGTPTWSFLWRQAVAELRAGHRCVAPDHLGFGLSDKPEHAPYRPRDHADRLHSLVRELDLRDVTLVLHDFGGPIGMDYALRDRANVKRVILMNTFLWPTEGDPTVEIVARVMGSPFGRFLYRRLNVSPRILLPGVYSDKDKLTSEIHHHYLAPFPAAPAREAMWRLAHELLASNDHYRHLWDQRSRLAKLPTLIVWGMNDPTFTPKHLARWEEALPTARVVRVPNAGHFVMEEAADTAIDAMQAFLNEVAPEQERASPATARTFLPSL